MKEEVSEFSNSYCYEASLSSQVDVLQMEQKEKEDHIQKLLLDLSQTQMEFKQHQETASKIVMTSAMSYELRLI